MYWVYDLPNWLFGILTVATFVLASLFGLTATHRLMRRSIDLSADHSDHNSFVSYFFGASVGLYGITLGLISVGAWESYSDVDAKAGAEASSIGALYRDMSSYPEPTRTHLQDATKEYIRYVIEEAWPQQRRGIVPTGGTLRVDVIQSHLYSFEPTTNGQIAIHNEAISQFNRFVEHRRQRLLAVTSGMPMVIWAVVLIGALLSMGTTWFFVMKSRNLHRLLVCWYSALLGVLVFLIGAMDNPFRGDFSIGPDAYIQVRDSLIRH
jgi:hypothetical protein